MSNATKPIELQNALTARLVAWQMYDAALEAGKPNDYIAEVVKIVDVCDERVAQLYKEWQSVGGTSDIESLALHPVTEAQQIARAIDATLHAEDSRFKKLGGYVKPTRNANGHTDTIQTAIDKCQLDANGHMLPYKATGRVGGSWDNHEIHSYTADGE